MDTRTVVLDLPNQELRIQNQVIISNLYPSITYRNQGEAYKTCGMVFENGVYTCNGLCLELIQRVHKDGICLEARLENRAEWDCEVSRVDCLCGKALNISDRINTLNGVCSLNVQLKSAVEEQLALNKISDADFFVPPDPINREENWLRVTDTAIFEVQGQKILFGFGGGMKAFGHIYIKTGGGKDREVCFGMSLDGICIPRQEEIKLDDLLISGTDDQRGFLPWASFCCEKYPSEKSKAPLGYCSWYQYEHEVTEKTILKASAEYSAFAQKYHRQALIQLDDGYQKAPFIWEPNDKFGSLSALAQKISEDGNIPGIWIAPTTILCNHPIIKEYPDIIQRDEITDRPYALSNWYWCSDQVPRKYNTYFLEPEHPLAREIMYGQIKAMTENGFKYLKIDFTQNVFAGRKLYNPQKTTFESMRSLFRLFREAAGESTEICACIGSVGRYVAGLADSFRIGGDIGGEFKAIKENLPAFTAAANAARNFAVVDPDVFFMRACKLTADENFMLTATIGLLGGSFISSDLPSQWDNAAKEKVGYFYSNRTPPRNLALRYNDDGMISALLCQYENEWKAAVYNWDNEKADREFSLENLPAAEIHAVYPNDAEVRPVDGAVRLYGMKPHSTVILQLK